MKKTIFTILILNLLIVNVEAKSTIEPNSANILFYDLSNETVIYGQNETKRTPIASLTKIMTFLVASDYIKNIDTKVTIRSNDLEGLVEQDASVAGFSLNERVTYKDLLYGLLLPSGADAALALVHNTYKTEDKFLNKMNELAKEIGLDSTNFTTTTGLDTSGNYSTLNDLLKLLKYAILDETFYEVFTSHEYITSNHKLNFKSTLKKNIDKYSLNLNYIIGSKTGTTKDAGLCMISLAEYNGIKYVLITTQAPLDYKIPYHIYDASIIYNDFFENYEYKNIFKENDILINLDVKKSLEKNIEISSLSDVNLYLKKSVSKDQLKYNYKSVKEISYKIKKGELIGTLDIVHDDKVLKTIDILMPKKLHYNYLVFIVPGLLLLFIYFKIK